LASPELIKKGEKEEESERQVRGEEQTNKHEIDAEQKQEEKRKTES
jgi:hypothetical protein